VDSRDLQVMREAGVEVEKYNPLAWFNLARLNHRDHRKLLIVDGRSGLSAAPDWPTSGKETPTRQNIGATPSFASKVRRSAKCRRLS